jgi:pimeloyl-ACP methyl ester carboxylesterase
MNGLPNLLMIHGYNHDPRTKLGEHSPFRPDGNFDRWPRIFTDHICEPVPWYSAIQFQDTAQAWKAGYTNTYAWSYSHLAVAAAEGLLVRVEGREGLDVVAHSLGTRVVLLAIKERPEAFRKVLLLNGAEIWREAIPIIEENPCVEFLNVAVGEDDVLASMGAKAAPGDGQKRCVGNGCPAGMRRLPNFDEVVLDDLFDQAYYYGLHGWDLQGDGPSYGDHSFSFEHEGNHPLFRAFFAGDLCN